MDIDRIDPQLRRGARALPPLPLDRPWGLRLVRGVMGRLPLGGRLAEGVTVDEVKVGQGAVRVATPDGEASRPGLLWIHGGGYLLGSARDSDAFCSQLARDLDVVVASVDYRLAPEHPFPAPLDDCLAAWTWLHTHAQERGIDPSRLAIGGQSAGGGLAAALVQRVHDRSPVQPVAQWLFCPMLDDRTAADRRLDRVRHRVWDNRANRAGWAGYLGQQPGAVRVPDYAVPVRREDMTGLPPAWIGVGDIDLFHDEDVAYAERLRAAGVPVELDVVPAAPHGFESWAAAAPVSQAFLGRAAAWLGKQLTG